MKPLVIGVGAAVALFELDPSGGVYMVSQVSLAALRNTLFLGLAFMSVSGVACSPAVTNITVRSPTPIAAAQDKAVVVIVQPTTQFASVNILDEHGQVLGQLNERSHTAIEVPAGQLKLYAVPENKGAWADRIEGTVEAGRIYFATISLRWGGVSFLALNPHSADSRWSEKDHYLAKTPHVQMDQQKIGLIKTQLGDASLLLADADKFVNQLDAAHRSERIIRAKDGI